MKILAEVGEYWWAFLIGAIIIFALCFLFYKARNKGLEEKELIEAKEKVVDNIPIWVAALGTKDNILDVTANGSRLVVEVKSTKQVNQETIKAVGATSIIEMSKKITIVLPYNASAVADAIKKEIN